MLLIKPLCFSASASARLSLNVPAAENSFCWAFSLPDHVQGLAPSMPRLPEYGELDVPNVPKNRSLTSNEPVPNCFELTKGDVYVLGVGEADRTMPVTVAGRRP